jgi:hypothetical protein
MEVAIPYNAVSYSLLTVQQIEARTPIFPITFRTSKAKERATEVDSAPLPVVTILDGKDYLKAYRRR